MWGLLGGAVLPGGRGLRMERALASQCVKAEL